MIPSNYHTHTIFCDGKDTPEELVLEAIKLGCKGIGFSGHSYTFFDERYCMSKKGTTQYKNCIKTLQKEYEEKIKIYLGVEQDYYSSEATNDYDYVIGSVHYIEKNGEYLPLDESKELQIKIVKNYYDGDFYSFVEDYFQTVADVYNKTKCDIIAHFDLITKFNRNNALFDTKHPRYIVAATDALENLMKSPASFEINTGGMARKLMDKPYPQDWIISLLNQNSKKIIYSSDCHSKENLLFGLI